MDRIKSKLNIGITVSFYKISHKIFNPVITEPMVSHETVCLDHALTNVEVVGDECKGDTCLVINSLDEPAWRKILSMMMTQPTQVSQRVSEQLSGQ